MSWRDLFNRDVRDEARVSPPPIKGVFTQVRDPAPGLHKVLTGRPLPRFAELRARYGDPASLPPIKSHQHQHEPWQIQDGADGPYCAACGEHVTEPTRVDFRDMLKTEGAWSVKSRLEVTLGRPYLATKLAEQLDPETGAKLCDRLEALLSTAYEQARVTLAAEVTQAVDARIQTWQAEQERRAREVTRERFGHR